MPRCYSLLAACHFAAPHATGLKRQEHDISNVKELTTNMSNNNTPKWVENIRQGNFDAVSEEFTQAAAQRVTAAQVNQQIEQITANAGPYARYVSAEAQLKAAHNIQQAIAQGRSVTPQTVLAEYNQTLRAELKNFRDSVNPGHGREAITINGGTLETYQPSDESVRSFVRERNERSEEMKARGRDLPVTPTK